MNTMVKFLTKEKENYLSFRSKKEKYNALLSFTGKSMSHLNMITIIKLERTTTIIRYGGIRVFRKKVS